MSEDKGQDQREKKRERKKRWSKEGNHKEKRGNSGGKTFAEGKEGRERRGWFRELYRRIGKRFCGWWSEIRDRSMLATASCH